LIYSPRILVLRSRAHGADAGVVLRELHPHLDVLRAELAVLEAQIALTSPAAPFPQTIAFTTRAAKI